MNRDCGEDIKNNRIENKGSVQQITNLSQHLKDKYEQLWEMSRDITNMAADERHICQSKFKFMMKSRIIKI